MKSIYALEKCEEKLDSIFLAGPTIRTYDHVNFESWRKQALKLLEDFKGIVYVPEYRDNIQSQEWTYSRQVDWEVEHLKKVTVILFWIPRELQFLPGFTTNVEFGEWMSSGKIVVGAPENSEKNEYLKERAIRNKVIWHNSLESCVVEALEKIAVSMIPKVWFTADTHFGSQRTLELSRRPFCNSIEMDWELIKRWNQVVAENDIIYHLGDFGDLKYLSHLNGEKIYLIIGNYDNDESFQKYNKVKVIQDHSVVVIRDKSFRLIHAPENIKYNDEFYLFGHIHKLQMVKKFGLNVGVDCHDFRPINEEIILFYRNAIEKHYDRNVFMV